MTLSIEAIASLLLVARIISVLFIIRVLVLQFKLFGTQIDFSLVPHLTKLQRKHVYLMRRVLFGISIVLLMGNVIPIAIDLLTIFSSTSRPDELFTTSIMYAFSNAITAMLSAIMIYILYQVAGLGNKE